VERGSVDRGCTRRQGAPPKWSWERPVVLADQEGAELCGRSSGSYPVAVTRPEGAEPTPSRRTEIASGLEQNSVYARRAQVGKNTGAHPRGSTLDDDNRAGDASTVGGCSSTLVPMNG